VATVNEPTPEEAVTALRAVGEGKERVITSALGTRWIWLGSGLVVFFYCVGIDLFPAASPWLTLATVALVLVAGVALRTRVGSTLLGRPVRVSSRSLSTTSGLLRFAPLLGVVIAVVLIIQLFHVPHGMIYYGALVGFYVGFLGPRFQLWLLRRQGRD
jgi:hypothetical protein